MKSVYTACIAGFIICGSKTTFSRGSEQQTETASAPYVLHAKMIGRPMTSDEMEQISSTKTNVNPKNATPLFGSTISLKHATFDDEGPEANGNGNEYGDSNHGDIVLEFTSIQQGGSVKPTTNLILDAQIGLVCEENDNSTRGRTFGAVSMTAMVTAQKPILKINGGWIRRAAIAMNQISCKNWDVYVLAGATVTHPGYGYKRVGKPLQKSIPTGIMTGAGTPGRRIKEYEQQGQVQKQNVNKFRQQLRAKPTRDELKINDLMKSGRKPDWQQKERRKRSNKRNAKILVHGYCANKNPFPLGHFTNSIGSNRGRTSGKVQTVEFIDPDGYATNNWKHDEFARKIARFTHEQGIDQCSIIAHSQGGAASLHLFNYYWSCLDESMRTMAVSDRTRLIQSVGTPYQGTKLANVGNADIIGKVVGQGCGSNEDLTEKGAKLWLRGISQRARSFVTYYTTSAKEGRSCTEETDLVLDRPNDGVVEKGKGMLAGGNFGGHTIAQCHTIGMNGYLPQAEDIKRNRMMDSFHIEMNSAASSGAEF